MTDPLLAAKTKLSVARRQISQLRQEVTTFLQQLKWEVVSEVDPMNIEEVWSFAFKESPPPEFSVSVGNVLHNIRSPLDQAIAAVVSSSGSNARNSGFIFGRDKQHFEQQINDRRAKHLPSDLKELIRRYQPWPPTTGKPGEGGNMILYWMNVLNRDDKHRMHLIPAFLRVSWQLSSLMIFDGQMLVIGNRSGQHLIGQGHVPLPRHVDHPTQYEFLTTTPGAKWQGEISPNVGVSIGGTRHFRRTDAIIALENMLATSSAIIEEIELQYFASSDIIA